MGVIMPDQINNHLDLKTQKHVLETAIDMHRDNLRDVLMEIQLLETKKKTIMNGLLFCRREHLRVEKDIQLGEILGPDENPMIQP